MSPRLLLRHHEPVPLDPGETVLAALRRSGLHMLYSCEEGYCQGCMLRTDGSVPREVQRGLSRELVDGGAFLACQWAPTEDVRVYLPGEKPSVAALLLAGGRSSRMGRPKDEVILRDGRAMRDHVLDALRPLGIPLRLSTGTEPRTGQTAAGLTVVPDETPYEGPLAAIVHALECGVEDGLLVVCCDQPMLNSDLLRRLLPSQPHGRPTFFETADGQRLDPFPGYFPRALLNSMKEALTAGERSPRRWAKTESPIYKTLAAGEQAALCSFNSAEELRAAGLIPPEDCQ